MIDVALDRVRTLDVVEWIAFAGRGSVTVPALLEEVCGAVAEAFDFDSVAAMRLDTDRVEVEELAFASAAPAARQDTEAPVSVSLLREAQATRSLTFRPAGDSTSTFALPLISGDRCLALLCGRYRPDSFTDWQALATVGIVAATLLEGALARHELEQLDVLKTEFIALAAHELRNPLASVYGISVVLNEQNDQLAEPARVELRNTLQEQTTRMVNLVEQLLDLSRLDLAPIEISVERVRLRPKIEELVNPLADTSPTAVTIVASPDIEAVLDPTALDRMLSNLVANSLRHGRPPVTITAERKDRHLRIAVEDRGEGVPPEFVPRLFDRFARGADSGGRADGSGLGLAIAQAYARAHGGEIIYEPAVPHGARFEVVIPVRGHAG